MVSAQTLKRIPESRAARGFLELDARVSVAIWDAINHNLKAIEVVGIYEENAFRAIKNKLIGNGYDVCITYSTPIVDEEEGPTSKYFATIEIEW